MRVAWSGMNRTCRGSRMEGNQAAGARDDERGQCETECGVDSLISCCRLKMQLNKLTLRLAERSRRWYSSVLVCSAYCFRFSQTSRCRSISESVSLSYPLQHSRAVAVVVCENDAQSGVL